MGTVTARLVRHLRQWDRPSQIAFVIAVCVVIVLLFLLAIVPFDARQSVLIGLFGALLMLQMIVLWGNRGMVTPYTRAQRHVMNGELESARDILQKQVDENRANVNVLTLLGNVYRQLGELEMSEGILTKALQLRPADYFPLYGFGRTLLAKGQYAEAVEYLQQALANGAPPITQFDLGHARYRLGHVDEARADLEAVAAIVDEDYRKLMTRYLLFCIGQVEQPSPRLVQSGIAFWEASAARYQTTPFGQALARDIEHMLTLIEEA